MPVYFAFTLFLSACLLFVVQPMLAKMILPLLGGTPAVWNTCMVFFQAALLAGYAYAHFLRTRLSLRAQVLVHGMVLLLPLIVLPIRVDNWQPPGSQDYPAGWLLGMLALGAGLPFFAVATSAPLLQAWFAHTRHETAEDPYYLYAASNAGSLTALLSYPLFVEPNLRLANQSWLWMAGYGMLIVLVAGCGFVIWRVGRGESAKTDASETPPAHADRLGETPSVERRLRWIALALVPSSLLLGVTTYITTDVAPIPLLWIVPLSLYLLSFILVFSRLGPILHLFMVPLLPILAIRIVVLWAEIELPFMRGDTEPGLVSVIAWHLAAFFVASMVCHGELARTRPAAAYLTEYYLWLAWGGVLGGILNALVAPIVFNRIIEYPLLMAAIFLLRPHWDLGPLRKLTLFRKRAAGVAPRAFASVKSAAGGRSATRLKQAAVSAKPARTSSWLGVRAPSFGTAAWCIFGLAMAGLFLRSAWGYDSRFERLRERNFFGVVHVQDPDDIPFIQFFHGTTLHGMQSRSPEERRFARTYFHADGPIGQVFQEFSGTKAKKKIGVIGLGIGSLAAYADRGQEITFYEIDPAVERIALDRRFFTFLSDCEKRGARVDVVLGDGRLQLARSKDRYGILVVDAFSSDSIPIHLLAREALGIYREHLEDDGILAFNITNKYLTLAPVLASLAADAGFVGFQQSDPGSSFPAITQTGRNASQWFIMARQEKDLGKLPEDRRWMRTSPRPGALVWSDDYCDLLSVFIWTEPGTQGAKQSSRVGLIHEGG